MLCPRTLENATIIDECLNSVMTCDSKELEETRDLHCTNATLISKTPIVCNSTIILNGTNVNETTTILNCYYGALPEKMAAFIPTTTTEAPITTTTEKSLSMGARIHIFFLKLVGKGEVVEKVTTTTMTPIEEDPRFGLKDNETLWVPEALTIPPETTEQPVTEEPYMLAMKMPKVYPNGTWGTEDKILDNFLQDLYKRSDSLPEYIIKVPVTTVSSSNNTNSEETTTSQTLNP